jgi:predicted peptidase
MKKYSLLTLLLALLAFCSYAKPTGTYKIVVEGFDWGAGVNKVILALNDTTSKVNAADYTVFASRKSSTGPIADPDNKRDIVTAYVSDENGARVKTGKNITLVLSVGPQIAISSPFQYQRSKGNVWVDYSLTIVQTKSGQVWDTSTGKIMPLIDQFDLTGKYTYNDKLTMSYATFTPKVKKDKAPLIIWLHGGGEGGTDPTVPLLGNKAANYAGEGIQSIFEGAYVLSPQCPGAWMHNTQGVGTQGKDNDIYNEGLMALIKDYVKANPGIDPSRIYVGGCSNGGYMALKLIFLYPDYFAAGYISALAYKSEYIPDSDIQKIKNVPIWFVHSKDDKTTVPDLTVVPVFDRLRKAGAKNVHFTYYDQVNDITNFYGGKGFQYNGHWSWVYLHENLPRTDLDGSPVRVNGKPVTIIEWLAAQKKGK